MSSRKHRPGSVKVRDKTHRPSKDDATMVDRLLALDCLCLCHRPQGPRDTRAAERPHDKGRCECRIRRALAGS